MLPSRDNCVQCEGSFQLQTKFAAEPLFMKICLTNDCFGITQNNCLALGVSDLIQRRIRLEFYIGFVAVWCRGCSSGPAIIFRSTL